jgi:hypothetical protein
MNIKTKRYTITPKQLKKMLIINYLKQMKILLIILLIFWLLIVILSITGQGSSQSMILPITTAIIYLLIIPLFINVNKLPKLNFLERYCEIDRDYFAVFYEDGSIVKLKFEHFIGAIKQGEFYFLYMAKGQFHYLPIAAFESESDINRFDLLLEGKKILKL